MTVYCRKVDFSVNLDGTWLFCIGKIFYTPKILVPNHLADATLNDAILFKCSLQNSVCKLCFKSSFL